MCLVSAFIIAAARSIPKTVQDSWEKASCVDGNRHAMNGLPPYKLLVKEILETLPSHRSQSFGEHTRWKTTVGNTHTLTLVHGEAERGWGWGALPHCLAFVVPEAAIQVTKDLSLTVLPAINPVCDIINSI